MNFTVADSMTSKMIENVLTLGVSNDKGLPIRSKYDDGTPAYTKSISGVKAIFSLKDKVFPITSLRKLAIKSAIGEMLWIYQDQTNDLEVLRKYGVKWWDDFEIKNNPKFAGTIGTAYGYTVNKYNLINNLLQGMTDDPLGRRHILNLWQEEDVQSQLKLGGLVPCAYETIFNIEIVPDMTEDFELELESSSNFHHRIPLKRVVSMQLNQRSSDFLVAGMINCIQYVALGLAICSHLTYTTGIKHELAIFSWSVTNLHIYGRHLQEAKNIIDLVEEYSGFDDLKFPTLKLNRICSFYDIKVEDFVVTGMEGLEPISTCKLEIAK